MNRPLFTITHAADFDGMEPAQLIALGEPLSFGPRRQRADNGTAFRLFDDDGILYYRGRMWDDGTEDEAFAPLDWASSEAGCARMDLYERHPDGVWRWSTL